MTIAGKADLSEQITMPWPINVHARANINNVEFSVTGTGVLRTNGVYDVDLNFDELPPNFHPCVVATPVISTCCGAGASMRNGGINMATMGVASYRVERELTLDGGSIRITGTAKLTPHFLQLDTECSGQVRLPNDMVGHSVYITRVKPMPGEGALHEIGQGSFFRANGEEIPVKITAQYKDFEPAYNSLPNPLTKPEYRFVTEDGELWGLNYRSRLHSIFDGVNSMSLIDRT